MSEDSWNWLQKNGYEKILNADVQRAWLAEQEEATLAKLKSDLASITRECELSDDRLEAVITNIDLIRAKEKQLQEHTGLLRDDLLDLNLVESQMMTTLEQCNFSSDKVAEKIFFRKAKELGFKSG